MGKTPSPRKKTKHKYCKSILNEAPHDIWSNLVQLHTTWALKWWFSKGNLFISEKSRLVKYFIWPDDVLAPHTKGIYFACSGCVM